MVSLESHILAKQQYNFIIEKGKNEAKKKEDEKLQLFI